MIRRIFNGLWLLWICRRFWFRVQFALYFYYLRNGKIPTGIIYIDPKVWKP